MSTEFYAKKKEPRIVYDEYSIGFRSGNDFYRTKPMFLGDNDNKMCFHSEEELQDFIKNTELFDFTDEYGKEYTKEEMIKIVKGENNDKCN